MYPNNATCLSWIFAVQDEDADTKDWKREFRCMNGMRGVRIYLLFITRNLLPFVFKKKVRDYEMLTRQDLQPLPKE
jgi:hypothetical protein